MSRSLFLVRQDAVTNWSGQVILKAMINHLFPSCIIRVIVSNDVHGGSEALHFKITEIKDGTFWGETMNTYGINLGTKLLSLKEGNKSTRRRRYVSACLLSNCFLPVLLSKL